MDVLPALTRSGHRPQYNGFHPAARLACWCLRHGFRLIELPDKNICKQMARVKRRNWLLPSSSLTAVLQHSFQRFDCLLRPQSKSTRSQWQRIISTMRTLSLRARESSQTGMRSSYSQPLAPWASKLSCSKGFTVVAWRSRLLPSK